MAAVADTAATVAEQLTKEVLWKVKLSELSQLANLLECVIEAHPPGIHF